MNPFDWTGPWFLLFYLVLGVFSYWFLRFYVSYRERRQPIPKLKMSDPFQIAFLRGGENEAIRIASISLVDRGLLRIIDASSKAPKLETTYPRDINLGKTRIERALLKLYRVGQESSAAFSDPECKHSCGSYQELLGEHRLVRNAEITQERAIPIGLIALLLLGVAGLKIYIALERDRENIAFLIILAVVLVYVLVLLIWRHRTGLGDRMLSDLKTLFQSLYMRRESLRPRMQTTDAALLAAVFGLSALPAAFQYARDIFRKASSSSSGSCGSACGSSCGGGGGGCGGCGS
jgi:uncharacterized protein (TIGR04222 family)